jgi:glycerophosphoryl diester phosphodiesterase
MSRTLNIAHRGARTLAPENTIAAARKALEVGADMWELDVSLTADGELVVMHDDTLTRTTNAESLFPNRAPWHVADFTLAEIKQLDTGGPFLTTDPFEQIGAGAITPLEQAALRGEPVPTLREALQFTADHRWRVNVEIKPLPAGMLTFPLAERVVAAIESLAMAGRVLVSSFVPLILMRIKALNPAIAVAVLSEGVLSPATLDRWLPHPGYDLTPMHYFSGDDPAAFLGQLGINVYHPYYAMVSPAVIRSLQAAGIALNVWTVNNPAHMHRLIEAGVSGLITDYPQLLTPILANAHNPNLTGFENL